MKLLLALPLLCATAMTMVAAEREKQLQDIGEVGGNVQNIAEAIAEDTGRTIFHIPSVGDTQAKYNGSWRMSKGFYAHSIFPSSNQLPIY